MDPQTFATISAVLLLLGNIAQFLYRVIGSASTPSQLNPEACVRLIKGRIFEHEVNCKNIDKAIAPMLDHLARIEKVLDALNQMHMEHSHHEH